MLVGLSRYVSCRITWAHILCDFLVVELHVAGSQDGDAQLQKISKAEDFTLPHCGLTLAKAASFHDIGMTAMYDEIEYVSYRGARLTQEIKWMGGRSFVWA